MDRRARKRIGRKSRSRVSRDEREPVEEEESARALDIGSPKIDFRAAGLHHRFSPLVKTALVPFHRPPAPRREEVG